MSNNGKSIISDKKAIITTPAEVVDPKEVWRVNDFNELIYAHGYEAYLDRAMRCACVEKATGQALSTCRNCLGRGWFFTDRRETRVIVQGMNNSKKFKDWGEVNAGQARVTARGSDKMGFMDRIILLELEAYYSEIIRPIMFESEIIAYPIYEPISITNMFLFISETQVLMPVPPEMYVVDKNKIVFDPELSTFVISDDMNDVNPPMTLTMRYSYNPVYHVIDANRELMRVRTKTDPLSDSRLTDMPINVLCRKAHYIFDPQKFGESLLENNMPT